MKITKTLLFVFLFTFLIGAISYFLFSALAKEEVVLQIPANEIKTPIVSATPQTDKKIEVAEEKVDWKETDPKKLKIKLLETGEGYHGDQVHAKSGEIWLGLFRDKGKYFLSKTKLKVLRVRDEIVDAENEKTGKSVFTNRKEPSVFLLKNAEILREGEIKTVYFSDENAEEYDESSKLESGTEKNFEFNGETYNLRVENKLSSSEYLGKGSKLVLSHNGKEQILTYLKRGCSDCTWNVYWVGDLDRDGKLDFYFDLTSHYNVSDKQLFISSQAEKGKFVKYVANFWRNGC